MYRITRALDSKTDATESTITIDAAIEAARKASTDSDNDGHTIVVRDGSQKGKIRAMALCGKVYWVDTCKKCKGTGSGGLAPSMYGGMTEQSCETCGVYGFTRGEPCGR